MVTCSEELLLPFHLSTNTAFGSSDTAVVSLQPSLFCLLLPCPFVKSLSQTETLTKEEKQ